MRHLSFDESKFARVVPCQIESGETDSIGENEWLCGNLLCRRKLGFWERLRTTLGYKVSGLEYGIVYCGPQDAQFFTCCILGEYLAQGMVVRGTVDCSGHFPHFRITQISSRSQLGHIRNWSAKELADWVGELLIIQPDLVGTIEYP